jgi:tRNA(Ile)-lysidine synthase
MNDQTETVLMNIIRGSGLTGLCGMQLVRNRIIRPLLGVTRSEIESYLQQEGQTFITDSTNQDNAYTRNRLRNELIPYIQEHMNENVINRISDMAATVSEAEDYIKRQARQAWTQCIVCHNKGNDDCIETVSIRLSTFLELDVILQKYVVRMALEKLSGACKNIYKTHVEDVTALAQMQAGKRICLPYGLTAVRKYDEILITQNETTAGDKTIISGAAPVTCASGQVIAEIGLDSIPETGCCRLPVNRIVYTEKQGYVFVRNVTLEYVEMLAIWDKNDYTKYFDCDKMRHILCGCLTIRFRQNGDRIMIDSAGVSKKLKKEFIDRKIPCDDRDSVLLVAVGQEILWAAGVRRSEEYKVQNCSGKILKISVELQEEE